MYVTTVQFQLLKTCLTVAANFIYWRSLSLTLKGHGVFTQTFIITLNELVIAVKRLFCCCWKSKQCKLLFEKNLFQRAKHEWILNSANFMWVTQYCQIILKYSEENKASCLDYRTWMSTNCPQLKSFISVWKSTWTCRDQKARNSDLSLLRVKHCTAPPT